MEGYDAKFHPPLEKRLECPICLLAQRDPMQTPCGHRFCAVCIQRALRLVSTVRVSCIIIIVYQPVVVKSVYVCVCVLPCLLRCTQLITRQCIHTRLVFNSLLNCLSPGAATAAAAAAAGWIRL